MTILFVVPISGTGVTMPWQPPDKSWEHRRTLGIIRWKSASCEDFLTVGKYLFITLSTSGNYGTYRGNWGNLFGELNELHKATFNLGKSPKLCNLKPRQKHWLTTTEGASKNIWAIWGINKPRNPQNTLSNVLNWEFLPGHQINWIFVFFSCYIH